MEEKFNRCNERNLNRYLILHQLPHWVIISNLFRNKLFFSRERLTESSDDDKLRNNYEVFSVKRGVVFNFIFFFLHFYNIAHVADYIFKIHFLCTGKRNCVISLWYSLSCCERESNLEYLQGKRVYIWFLFIC